MNSSEPSPQSDTLSPLLSHTNSQLPVCFKKVGGKNRNLILNHFPVSANLETAVSRAAVLAQMVVIPSLDMTQSFLLSCYSCQLDAAMFSSHWIDLACSLSWDLDNIDGIAWNDCSLSKKGLNDCFFNPQLGSYFENIFVATWELVLSSNFWVLSISSKTNISSDKLNLILVLPLLTQFSLSQSWSLWWFFWDTDRLASSLESYQTKNNLKTASVFLYSLLAPHL